MPAIFSHLTNPIKSIFGWSSDELSEKEYGEYYDVFLSFRGEDTRKGFTDHLYYYLKVAGLSVFKDDVSLPFGKEIADILPKAMKASRIAMPILSKNYAASNWCMNELLTMLELRKTVNLIVIPVFYDVTPGQVRHQTGSYAKAFENYSKRCDIDGKTIEAWKKALAEVSLLTGLELATATGGKEGEFTKLIVSKISDELNNAEPYSNSARIEKLVKETNRNFDLEMTTLTMLYFSKDSSEKKIAQDIIRDTGELFDSCSYVKDVRRTAQQPNGLESLQNQLLYDLSMEKGHGSLMGSPDRLNDLKSKFRNKKVLIILGDVGDTRQLDALAGQLDWFGPGSRIIVTTRNRQLCKAHQVTDVYDCTNR